MDAVVGQFVHLLAGFTIQAVEAFFRDGIFRIVNRFTLRLPLIEAAVIEPRGVVTSPPGCTIGAGSGRMTFRRFHDSIILHQCHA